MIQRYDRFALVGVASVVAAVACVAAAREQAAPADGTKSAGGLQGQRVHRGESGKLVYTADAEGNILPDFSNCGYDGGGVELPQVPVRETVQPSAADAGALIQAAIDKVAALPADRNGLRGAVLLKRGRYPIAGSIHIKTSGVVLRGEGQEENGTVLVATGTGQRTLVDVGGEGSWQEVKGTRHAVAARYVPVGARAIPLESAAGLQVGDRVIVHRPSTKEWIHVLGMDRIPPRKNGGKVVEWTPGSKDLLFDRVVTAVRGNEIDIDAPVTCALDPRYGGGAVYQYTFPERIRQVGVEGLRGVSEYHGETDEKHSWNLLRLEAVENAWVSHVTALHFVLSAVATGKHAKWVTVQDCACLDAISEITGGRRYSFNDSGQLTLWQRCHARNGRHDFVTGSSVPGPVVFLDCTAELTHADAGPHRRWAVGILYDNVHTTGQLNVRNRGNMGSGHGWAGANHVFWNCKAGEITCEKPPTAENWAIGCSAKQRHGDGYWDSFDHPVEPRSLYQAQLAERMVKR